MRSSFTDVSRFWIHSTSTMTDERSSLRARNILCIAPKLAFVKSPVLTSSYPSSDSVPDHNVILICEALCINTSPFQLLYGVFYPGSFLIIFSDFSGTRICFLFKYLSIPKIPLWRPLDIPFSDLYDLLPPFLPVFLLTINFINNFKKHIVILFFFYVHNVCIIE